MSRLHKNKQYYSDVEKTGRHVRKEISTGLELLKKIDKSIVTVFGGHKVSAEHPFYQHCKNVAFELGKKGYAIMTGGGSGMMEAANRGATEAGALSIGIKAKLLKKELAKGSIFTHKLALRFIFVRRFLLAIKSEALIFYPGGFGTLNELFEYATLMKTGIVDKVPIICVNKEFWQGLFEWLHDKPLKENLYMSQTDDLKLLHIVDDLEEIMRIIEKK